MDYRRQFRLSSGALRDCDESKKRLFSLQLERRQDRGSLYIAYMRDSGCIFFSFSGFPIRCWFLKLKLAATLVECSSLTWHRPGTLFLLIPDRRKLCPSSPDIVLNSLHCVYGAKSFKPTNRGTPLWLYRPYNLERNSARLGSLFSILRLIHPRNKEARSLGGLNLFISSEKSTKFFVKRTAPGHPPYSSTNGSC